MLTRRAFTRLAILFVALGNSLFLAGCNLWSEILSWVPVGGAALNSILSLLMANGVPVAPALQAIVNLIEAAFADLTAAVKEYQSITPPPAGALDKIKAAFKAVTDNFSAFLQQLGVSGGLLAVIAGIAQIVFSTIAGFVNQLPSAKPIHASTVRVAAKDFPVVAKKRSTHQFKKDVDAVLDAGKATGVTVPEKAYL